ncbi:DivIVA domain-containing protein [Nocardioides sp. R-C-SC26]|uniref:DivIVA domain-containing protein n=1 Tax=Nocardioides sp. R-C-SC26 TaxID=2870414 RepID=UPI001E286AFB|nr:DivIVA domain-containing protein [Nocardioides sp. R-C-SC26]
MVWLCAIVAILVLGAVAAVAAGRGAPMAVEHGDRPDVLPGSVGRDGTLPLTGEHLRRVRFPVVLRGYRMDDVDALLDRVARQLDGGPVAEDDDAGHQGPSGAL